MKRTRADTFPYQQLPFVLRICCLKFLDIDDSNDTKPFANYGYFIDDCMRKIYRVFDFHIILDLVDDERKQKYISGIDTCELILNPLEFEKNDILILELGKKLSRIEVCFWSVAGIGNSTDLYDALDYFTWPKNVRSFSSHIEHTGPEDNSSDDDEEDNVYVYEHLMDSLKHEKVNQVTFELDTLNAHGDTYDELLKAISEMTNEQKSKLAIDVQTFRYFGCSEDTRHLEESIDTKEFWQQVGPYVTNINFARNTLPINDWDESVDFMLNTVMPTLTKLTEFDCTPHLFNALCKQKNTNNISLITVAGADRDRMNSVHILDLLDFAHRCNCKYIIITHCCVSVYDKKEIKEMIKNVKEKEQTNPSLEIEFIKCWFEIDDGDAPSYGQHLDGEFTLAKLCDRIEHEIQQMEDGDYWIY